MPRTSLLLLFCFLMPAFGCQKEVPPAATSAAPRQAAAKLSILVVDDPQMAAGLKLLRGEWAERTGGPLTVEEWPLDQLLAAAELSADLIIYPSRCVGTLVDRNWLRPVRDSVLRSSDLAIEEMFPLIRNATLRYGDQVYALSLGEPPLLLASPLAAKIEAMPSIWEQVNFRLAAEKSTLKYPRAVEFLARGIAYAQHRGQTVGCFDVETMQPRIARAPFVKALQQMLENEKSTANQPENGQVSCWLSASTSARAEPTVFAPLPRAGQVYDPLRETWKNNDSDQPLVFLGLAGRSVSVTRSTRNSASAFKLLNWLISESIATQLSPRSQATAWFRQSQVTKANKWLARGEADDEAAALVTRLLASDNCYLLPRIPGVDEYLQQLDEVLALAIANVQPAEKTLEKVVQQWNALTDRYGRDRQRVAYRRHLRLSDQ